ncbi:MAG: VapC toxin family PIN domain ribonuclease [Acidobacteria bacterium]|nr:MAG: VapC toxin family PIN domain ribonuclease [Acidobacteriota bacterium]
MILADVNVLVYAFRADAHDHIQYRDWLDRAAIGPEPLGVSSLVLSAFIRIVTHPRIFAEPSSLDAAIDSAERVSRHPNSLFVTPGPRHWDLFIDLCRRTSATGKLIPDAYLAALAIDTGSEWITTDRDYSRFPRLRWRHPFDKSSRVNPA